jgi:hypothetical protein
MPPAEEAAASAGQGLVVIGRKLKEVARHAAQGNARERN